VVDSPADMRTAEGGPAGLARKRSPLSRYEVPEGWVARGFEFEVEWPQDPGRVRSHFGARRFAYNWALGQVKDDMEARQADPEHGAVAWNLYALRQRWNQVKGGIAPWWAENSKEAYATGISDLCTALGNWKASRSGKRAGRPAGFPKFRSRHSDRGRVRFTTGALRVAPDRRTITLPVIGALRSKENTRRLERLVSTGKARILNATLSERWGRLFVSLGCIVAAHEWPEPSRARAGVDLGLRTLATMADTDGKIEKVPNPAPLRAALAQRRRAGRQMSRRIPGSRGYGEAKAKLARLDRRCVHLRRQATHQLTTMLAETYREVVIEDLDLAAMKRGMGRRAFRRSVSDAALGRVRPQLTYKMAWRGTHLTVADRWFASSKIHHGCGCRLIEPRRLAQMLVCIVTGELVDRDINAALNLRDWPDHASCSTVGAAAPIASESSDGQDAGPPGAVGGRVRPGLPARAASGEARTRNGTPRRGAACAATTSNSAATDRLRGGLKPRADVGR
jgi:putative transposase